MQKPFEYQILTYPYSQKFISMNPKERKAYHAWFMEIKEQRVLYFREQCALNLGIPVEQMDYSGSSLLYAWRFFLSVAATEVFSGDPAEGVIVNSALLKKGMVPESIYTPPEKQLTKFTEMLLIDVGMYLGECFVRSHPCLKWGLYRNKDAFFGNHTVIQGFTDMYNPDFHPVVDPVQLCEGLAHVLYKKHIPSDAEYELCKAFHWHCADVPDDGLSML